MGLDFGRSDDRDRYELCSGLDFALEGLLRESEHSGSTENNQKGKDRRSSIS